MTADPTLAERLNAGIALHLRGELQEAEGHYLAVLALEPTHAEAHKLLAVIALDRGELERAAALVSRLLPCSRSPASTCIFWGASGFGKATFRMRVVA